MIISKKTKFVIYKFCGMIFNCITQIPFLLRYSGCNIDQLPLYKKIPIKTPTYDKSGQAVHPDILVQNESPFYVLAFTPYPATNDYYENPSVLVSDDGLHFHEERKNLNPLASAPETDHNDDPDIALFGGVYYLVYLETRRPEKQNIHLLTSTDRILWQDSIIHTQNFENHGNIQFPVSPAQVYFGTPDSDGNTGYLYYVMNVEKSDPPRHYIQYVTGQAPGCFDFESPDTPVFDNLPVIPWHVDIITDSARTPFLYYMLISAVRHGQGRKHYSLYIARSSDLKHWTFCGREVLSGCYRSSGFIKDGILTVCYSENKPRIFKSWRIGVYKIKISDFFGD